MKNLELIGFLIVLASMAGCSAGLVNNTGPVTMLGLVGFVVGLVVFIAGRFR